MTPAWRAVRVVILVAGAAVALACVPSFRLADWPIYVVFVLVSVVLFLPYVEVLPTVALPLPEMAAEIAFLYIGGPPIIVLRGLAPALTWGLRRLLPERWKVRFPQLRTEGPAMRRELFGHGTATAANTALAPGWAWATLTLGLGVRWWVASSLVPDDLPATSPGAILVAEAAGYACWWLLSILPLYPDRPLIALSVITLTGEHKLRSAVSDVGLIVVSALTPFVVLITYEYCAHGLLGAAAWSLSALGLHFIFKRLNDRRLRVEEQNRRLETLNRELEHRERLSAIGKMSSVVSHQILQQLGVIGIYADLIRNVDDAGDTAAVLEQARSNAVAIEGALGDVNRVLRDLLVFSKDLRLNLYEHPLTQVVDECIEECRAEAESRAVTLRAEYSAEVRLLLDKLKMKQALTNVLRNAIEVSPPASEVQARVAVRNGTVEISVKDQGPGIAAEDREAVFAPFFTTKDHGTGLGLAIAREFTEAHGGRLHVDHPADRPGATFVFLLPLGQSSRD